MYVLAALMTVVSIVAAGMAFFHWKYSHRPGAKLGGIVLLLMLWPVWCTVPKLARDEAHHATDVQRRKALVEGRSSFADVVRLETTNSIDRIVRQQDVLGGAWFLPVESLNVRREASRTSARVATLSPDDRVWVPGIAQRSGEWIRITKPYSGWVNQKYLVIVASQGEMGLAGWNQRPYYAIRAGNVRSAPSTRAGIIGHVGAGEKCVRVEQRGLWLRIRRGDQLGWIHASNLRLADTTEANIAYVEASKFSLRYAFPEKTFSGKILGVVFGVILGLVLAVVFPRWKMPDNVMIAKLAVTILYFGIKNRVHLIGMSNNELMIMVVSAGLLGAFVELFSESVVEKLRETRYS